EFEKRIIERSSNLYKGYYWLSWEIYKLSSWSVGFIIVFNLLLLGLCIGSPVLSGIMLLGSFLFFSIHYFLGVLITLFKVRRRITLFSALLALSLAWILLFSSMFFQASRPPDIVTVVIFIVVFMSWTIPFFTRWAYVLVQAYGGKYDRDIDKSMQQQ
ncbi:MAG: hypothetical protein ACPL4E_05325, partial [Thermoproteota archaeon]